MKPIPRLEFSDRFLQPIVNEERLAITDERLKVLRVHRIHQTNPKEIRLYRDDSSLAFLIALEYARSRVGMPNRQFELAVGDTRRRVLPALEMRLELRIARRDLLDLRLSERDGSLEHDCDKSQTSDSHVQTPDSLSW